MYLWWGYFRTNKEIYLIWFSKFLFSPGATYFRILQSNFFSFSKSLSPSFQIKVFDLNGCLCCTIHEKKNGWGSEWPRKESPLDEIVSNLGSHEKVKVRQNWHQIKWGSDCTVEPPNTLRTQASILKIVNHFFRAILIMQNILLQFLHMSHFFQPLCPKFLLQSPDSLKLTRWGRSGRFHAKCRHRKTTQLIQTTWIGLSCWRSERDHKHTLRDSICTGR